MGSRRTFGIGRNIAGITRPERLSSGVSSSSSPSEEAGGGGTALLTFAERMGEAGVLVRGTFAGRVRCCWSKPCDVMGVGSSFS